jgi:Protein phosphatase 2C
MWKLIYGSVKGTSHAHSGLPCQDYCVGAAGQTLAAACSDGAGSAALSHFGSRAAAEHFLSLATDWTADTPPDRSDVESWVSAARDRVLAEAVSQGAVARQLACTFLGAVIGDGWAVFAQIGDGAIVFDGEDGYELAFWPDNGEYANATRFLTDEDYLRHLRIEIVPRMICELSVFTDGLQMLALDFAAARVHDRFFTPMFRALHNGPDEAVLRSALLKFMDSQRVNERTDDDKTLLLAARTNAPNTDQTTA